MIEISVISPVFNGKLFIESCLRNVIDQNCPVAEHIVIDGGSTDGTVEILKKFSAKYPHIRYISEKDAGQSDAMNKGIKMAKGKIISFLNVDDYYQNNVCNQVVQSFKTLPDLSFVTGNCKIWNDAGELVVYSQPKYMTFTSVYLGIMLERESAHIFPLNPSCYFYHKSIHEQVGLYEVSDHYTMDFDFIVRLLVNSRINIVYKNEHWGNYRQIAGTKTMDQYRLGNSKTNLQKIVKEYYSKIALRDKIRIRLKVYRFRHKATFVVIDKVRNLLKIF